MLIVFPHLTRVHAHSIELLSHEYPHPHAIQPVHNVFLPNLAGQRHVRKGFF